MVPHSLEIPLNIIPRMPIDLVFDFYTIGVTIWNAISINIQNALFNIETAQYTIQTQYNSHLTCFSKTNNGICISS